MSANLLKFVSRMHYTSYPMRQLFIQHIRYSSQKIQLPFVNTPVCYCKGYSRMKMNRVSKSYHLLFKQTACESPRMFCSDRPTALPPDPYDYGADLAPTAGMVCRKVDFLSRDTCWYFQNMETLPIAVSALEVLHQIVLLLPFV